MLLWIVIYSFFQSGDFNDEVVILFGNVIFWATVVVSVVIALGMIICIRGIHVLLKTLFYSTTIFDQVRFDLIPTPRSRYCPGDVGPG